MIGWLKIMFAWQQRNFFFFFGFIIRHHIQYTQWTRERQNITFETKSINLVFNYITRGGWLFWKGVQFAYIIVIFDISITFYLVMSIETTTAGIKIIPLFWNSDTSS